MEHIPGPWHVYDGDEVRAKGGRGIAIAIHTIAHDLDIGQEQRERKANASLIAAAPDLLAACRSAMAEIAIMDVSSLPRYDQEHYLKAIHILDAAIAKAKAKGDQCPTE